MIPEDLGWALSTLSRRRRLYDLYLAYADGRHRLAFATERIRDAFGDVFRAFSLNLCGTVIDTIADRLQVIGWTSPASESGAADVQAVWEANLMASRHGQVHRDALAAGDAYVLVWQDLLGRVRIYDESPREMIGRPDPDAPGELRYAVKCWVEGKRVRVTVYYADRIERYITDSETARIPEPDALRPIRPMDLPAGADSRDVVPNGWGVVPVFHFPNNPGTDGLGVSELRDVKAPQDVLNKSVADLLATMEYQALPLRFLIGYEAEKRPDGTEIPLFNEARNRVVTLPRNASVQELPGADPTPLIAVKQEAAADVARVSGVPLHTLLLVGSGEWPSGQALRVAEARLVSKADDRMTAWSPRWARVGALAARMRQTAPGEVRALWAPRHTLPSDEEAARAAVEKQRAGIPRSQTWREMGYSDSQIEEFEKAYQEDQARNAALQASAFSAGDPAATGGF